MGQSDLESAMNRPIDIGDSITFPTEFGILLVETFDPIYFDKPVSADCVHFDILSLRYVFELRTGDQWDGVRVYASCEWVKQHLESTS